MTMQHGPTGQHPAGPPSGDRLPAQEIARQTAKLLWTERDHFLRLAVVPVCVGFALDLWMLSLLPDDTAQLPAEGELPDIGWMLVFLLGILPLTLFAVNCQRLTVLGPGAVPGLGLRWGWRETRFLLTGAAISLIAAFAVAVPASLYGALVLGTAQLPFHVYAVAMPVYLFLFLRMSLALPAAALDRPGFIGRSWQATQGLGLRFLLAAALVMLPLQLAMLAFMWLLTASGLYGLAPMASGFLMTAAAYVPAAATAVVIALVYRRLAIPAGFTV